MPSTPDRPLPDFITARLNDRSLPLHMRAYTAEMWIVKAPAAPRLLAAGFTEYESAQILEITRPQLRKMVRYCNGEPIDRPRDPSTGTRRKRRARALIGTTIEDAAPSPSASATQGRIAFDLEPEREPE